MKKLLPCSNDTAPRIEVENLKNVLNFQRSHTTRFTLFIHLNKFITSNDLAKKMQSINSVNVFFNRQVFFLLFLKLNVYFGVE